MKMDKRALLAFSQLQPHQQQQLYDFQQQKPQFNFNQQSQAQSHSQPQLSAASGAVGRTHLRQPSHRRSSILSDRESVCSGSGVSATGRGKRSRGSRNISMRAAAIGGGYNTYSRGAVSKKSRPMDYTNYAYNEAVGRLKVMLAESSFTTPPKIGGSSTYMRGYSNFNDDSDNFSDNLSAVDRPVLSDISKYLTPSQKARITNYRQPKKVALGSVYSSSKENLAAQMAGAGSSGAGAGGGVSGIGHIPPPVMDYYGMAAATKPLLGPGTDSVQAPVEIFNFIEKQEDYIEQLEKESNYCRNELTNLLGKVKDVISENEQLTENARSELAALGSAHGHGKKMEKMTQNLITSPSSDSEELHLYNSALSKKKGTPRSKSKDSHQQSEQQQLVRSPRYASAPNIVYEARISELEAELTQANIDLKRVRTENDELKRKLANVDTALTLKSPGGHSINCETHRKQIEHLQNDKLALEETIRHLQKSLDEAKSQQYGNTSKRYMSDLLAMERSQSEMEVKHLRDELDRQHERVRELQHDMARRLAEERSNAERRYNTQVDQLGGDLSQQWEQMTKLQLDVERQKRNETDLKRDLTNRNSQIEELKNELRSNRSTFLADMAQVNAEKQSLEQEINALRLHLDRAAREAKTEAARFNAEITSLRQRLDRGDADLLHSKREVLRLNDEIANLEKELAFGELKNEIRPTKKDLDKRISEMQEKHVGTVNELEEMIQSQKHLMDKLTGECKSLTNKLEDTTLKHKTEISSLQSNVEFLTNRMINNDRHKIDSTPTSYNSLPAVKASTYDYKPSSASSYGGGGETARSSALDDYLKSSPYNYDSVLGKSSAGDSLTSGTNGLAKSSTSAALSPTRAATSSSAYDGNQRTSAGGLYDPVSSGSAAYTTAPSGGGANNNNNGGGTNGNTLSDYKNDDYKIGDYSKSAYDYGNIGGTRNTTTGGADIDDENRKDNVGLGEKEHRNGGGDITKSSSDPINSTAAALSSIGDIGKSTEYNPSSGYGTGDANMAGGNAIGEVGAGGNGAGGTTDYTADYNTDYSGYEGYDTSAYDQQQYGTGDGGQVGGYGDYSTADYDPAAYQYDTTANDPTVAAAAPTPSSPPQPTASAAAASASPTASGFAANTAGRTATESRTQPRTSGGALGSGGAGGQLSGGGKSNLPQQYASSAAKK